MEEQEHRNILPKGSLLQEYEIESVLGKPGGFGITYKATDTNLKQFVAVKEYLPTEFAIREGRSTVCVRSTSDKEAFEWGLKCFTEEAQVLARFRHSNIVRILRFFKENNTAYMVMEYQEGESLAEYLKRFKILPEEDLLTIILPLLDGLEAIHQAKLLHRDIKPNNIYIRRDKTPVLLDFGSARYAIGEKSHTVTSIVSPGYAPLEQYDNDIAEQGEWTDIYALGAVMYCAITGEPPPASTRRALKDEYPEISATKKGKGKYQERLLTAIDWALQLNREDRPQSIEAWRQTFAPATTHQATIMPIARRTPPRLSEAKRSLLTSIGILVFLLFAVMLGVIFYQYTELNSEKIAHSRLEELLREEQRSHAQTEKKLKEMEKERKSTKDMVERIKSLEQTIQTSDGKTELVNKYHNVTRVTDDDFLNIRAQPGASNRILGSIPPREMCILYLGEHRIVDDGKNEHIWIKIHYYDKVQGQAVEGWVNSYYLASANKKLCEIEDDDQEKPNDDQENTKID